MTEKYLFDFGIGDVFPGYKKVTEESLYNEKNGFGFSKSDQMYMVDRKTPKPMLRDFCIPLGNSFHR